jgi:hypothetical protein
MFSQNSERQYVGFACAPTEASNQCAQNFLYIHWESRMPLPMCFDKPLRIDTDGRGLSSQIDRFGDRVLPLHVVLRFDLVSIEPELPPAIYGAEEGFHTDNGRLSILMQNERISGFVKSHHCAKRYESVMGEQIPLPVLDLFNLLRREVKAEAQLPEHLKVFLG